MKSKSRNPLWLRVLDLVTRGVLAGSVSYLLTGAFSPFLTVILLAYLYFGKAKYGPQGELLCLEDAKDSLIASVAWPYLAWYALSYGGRMTRERRIDGINLLVLRMLEDAGGRRLPRPTGMLVPSGFSLSGRDR